MPLINGLKSRCSDGTTHLRPLPSGRMSARHGFLAAAALSATGVFVLLLATNALTALLALSNILIYVLLYTPLKARNSLCTLVGAVCGAIPPMMGWTAVRGELDYAAWILAAILFIWQIPHFLALAWLYRDDYKRGGFRMLPLIDPVGRITCQVIVIYTLALIPLGACLALTGLTGWVSVLGSVAIGVYFFILSIRLYFQRNDHNARSVFFASLIYLPLVLGFMVIDKQELPPQGAMISQAQLEQDLTYADLDRIHVNLQ